MTKLAFVDTETTGLDPDLHQIWEVGLILREENGDEHEHRWFLPVDLGRADPIALSIGQYHERFPDDPVKVSELDVFAAQFARQTRGAHLVGAVVSFDAERLWKLLRANGACPEWHYHLIDVEGLAVGALAARGLTFPLTLPWDSKLLSHWMEVDPGEFEAHTALGDARWAKALYDAVMASSS